MDSQRRGAVLFTANGLQQASCFVGISNQISKSGTTDIPDEMYHVHARKRIWEDWQFFLERSPIYHVEKCRTPLLIMHGKEDPRVHPSQSMELYRNLKILDQTPVRLVFYPGEGHGNRKGRWAIRLQSASNAMDAALPERFRS